MGSSGLGCLKKSNSHRRAGERKWEKVKKLSELSPNFSKKRFPRKISGKTNKAKKIEDAGMRLKNGYLYIINKKTELTLRSSS